MATTKVTVTLDDDQLAAIRAHVRAGKAKSVSGFVKHAISVSLDDIAAWRVMLDQALEETGGPPTAKERAWADSVLRGRRKQKRARKAA